MKTVHNLILVLQSSVALVGVSAESQVPKASRQTDPGSPTARELQLTFENNENAGTVVALAVERFNYDRKNGQHCVLALSEDIEVSKYTDGKFTVIAVPQDAGTNRTGIELFVHSYNHMVIRDADSQFNAGNLDYAERVYKLLLKYDPTNSYSDALRKRISLVAKAKAEKSITTAAMEIRNLDPKYGMSSVFSDMGTKSPVAVPDLLGFDIKNLVQPPPRK